MAAFLLGVRFGAIGVATAYCATYFGLLAYPGFAIPFRLIDLRVRDFARAMWPQLAFTASYGRRMLVVAANARSIRFAERVDKGKFHLLYWSGCLHRRPSSFQTASCAVLGRSGKSFGKQACNKRDGDSDVLVVAETPCLNRPADDQV